jgi:hypothetical protein
MTSTKNKEKKPKVSSRLLKKPKLSSLTRSKSVAKLNTLLRDLEHLAGLTSLLSERLKLLKKSGQYWDMQKQSMGLKDETLLFQSTIRLLMGSIIENLRLLLKEEKSLFLYLESVTQQQLKT